MSDGVMPPAVSQDPSIDASDGNGGASGADLATILAALEARANDAIRKVSDLSGRVKKLEPRGRREQNGAESPPASSSSSSDSMAALRLGRILGQLPEDVASELEETMSQGAISLPEAERAARMALSIAARLYDARKIQSDAGGATPPKPPRGIGATPAASTAAAPKTRAEYVQMIAKAKAGPEREALKAAFSDLDLSKLPPW